jgi:hypothetical protein
MHRREAPQHYPTSSVPAASPRNEQRRADGSIGTEAFAARIAAHWGRGSRGRRAAHPEENAMMTLCIRYTLDPNKLADFETYARALPRPIERCGGKFVAYYLPTKVAGPTNTALGLIEFPNLATYERYREKLLADPDAVESLRRADAAGCILNEERSIVRRIPEAGH